MIEDSIRTLMLRHNGVKSMVALRIYPAITAATPALPYITYQRITTDHLDALGGSAGTGRATVQVNCWTDTYKEARQLAEYVRHALQGYIGTVGDDVIEAIVMTDDRDAPEAPGAGESKGVQGVQLDFGIWFTESIPTFT